jgi:hypothetical protein
MRTRLSDWSQRCSVEFKSGNLDDQGSTLELWLARKSTVARVVCGLALSCWKTFLCVLMTGRIWGWRISLQYLCAVKLPGTRTSGVRQL